MTTGDIEDSEELGSGADVDAGSDAGADADADAGASAGAGAGAGAGADSDAGVSGPVDQLGIPMSREPTIDDVRGDGEAHRRFAFGCSLVVTLFVIAFWVVRGYLL